MPTQITKPSVSSQAQTTLAEYHHHLSQELDLSPASVRNYLGDVRLFMVWYEGEEAPFDPRKIATPTITRYREHLQRGLGLKPNTVNRYLISLKQYFQWVIDQELIRHDPSSPVKLVAQTTQSPRHLSDKEEAELVGAVTSGKNIRDLTVITLMLHTGLRVSEVCQLKGEDVIVQKRGGYLRVWGKGNKYREVPLNATVREALLRYEHDEKTEMQKGEFLFVSRRTKTKLTPRGLGFLIAKYAKQAGISQLRAHDLRHRFGYRMAERVPLHRLAQIMGHNSLDTTLIYVQGTSQDLQRAVETIAWQ